MLEAALKAEEEAVAGYKTRAREADQFGDRGLAVQLEDMIREETTHMEETRRILRGWPL